MIELNKIYNEDCLEGMKRIPDGSVDCVICDLPYGTTACDWDSVIPFAWIKEKHSDRYILITEVNRLSIKEKEGCFFTDGFKYYTFADGTPFGIKTEELL